jgi:hypothetical protein
MEERTYIQGSLFFDNNIVQTNMKIGFRIQGDISRTFSKKSWKISFEGSQYGNTKWKDLEGFYLKGAVFDPSYAREELSTAVTYRFPQCFSNLSLVWLLQ